VGVCRWLLIVIVLLYVAALGLWLVGPFGLFGQQRDPLAGVFPVALGWPWNRAVNVASEPLRPWLAAAAPLVGIALVAILCRLWSFPREKDET
jgi:hypothetical protein